MAADPLSFKAKLYAPLKGKGWTFANLPASASAALGKRGQVAVLLTVGKKVFRTSCFADGKGGHMIQLNAEMRKATGKEAGDTMAFHLRLDDGPVKVSVPPAMAKAIRAHPAAAELWQDLTPKARAMWVGWVTGAKREETKANRIDKTVEQLAEGVRWPSG
jgi:Domain of unknown function (DUF1905)/Bacteriocin-protection, YdeI or OmpD-Associated